MAIGTITGSEYATFTDATTRTCAVPAGTADGDTLVAYVVLSQDDTAASAITVTSGTWAQTGFARTTAIGRSAVLIRTWNTGDPTTYTFGKTGSATSGTFAVVMVKIPGSNPTPVVAPTATNQATQSTSIACPAVTVPSGDDHLVVRFYHTYYFNASKDGTDTLTAPSGFTERSDQSDEWCSVGAATLLRGVGTQAAGNATASGSDTAARGRGVSLVFAPGSQSITATGITTTQAFGSTVVSPAAVEIAPTGIATAETFGPPTLNLAITPTGIASAEAIGSVDVTNNTLTPTGIASDEAFGTVEIRNYGLGAVGIPSAEAFGTPLVRLVITATGILTGQAFGAVAINLTVTPAGIGSGQAFGAPAVQVGDVAITPAGIASGEAVGTPRFTLTIDTSSLRTRARSHATADYELVCVARIPQTSGPPVFLEIDPIDWSGLSWTDELSRPQRLDASVAIATLTEPVVQRLQDLAQNASELWLYRDGRLVFAGPWQGWLVQDEKTLTLQAAGLLGYLRYWDVSSDLTFAGVDQHFIVKGLVDHWQTQEYGHFGIDTSGVTPSGQLRDATYLAKEDHNIGQRVEELGRRENGFDVEVDPASRALRLWSPQQGVDRSSGEDAIVFDARNVTSTNVSCSVAPGAIASEAFGTGTGTGDAVRAVKSNPELRARFGRTAITATFDGVSEQATIDAHVQGLLDARREALLIPGPDVRTVPDADLAAYNVGDVVAYELHDRLGVRGAFRLRKRQVSVSKTGTERTAMEFV